MKKLIGIIIVILVLAAAGVIGGAYWSGLQAERWYQEALAKASKSGEVKLSTVSYQRGLFSSQAVTRVSGFAGLPEGSDADMPDPSFSIRQDIYHGPLPFAGRNVPGVPMQWTGAVVRTTLDTDSSAWTRELAKWYGNQEPVVVISEVAFDGAIDTQITMPPLTLNDVEDVQHLEFSGLQGQFQATAQAAVQGNMTIDGLEVVGKPDAAGGHVKLSDLIMTVDQHKGAFSQYFGESSFKIGELRAEDKTTGAPLVMTGLSMVASASQQDAQQIAGEVLVKADQVTFNEQSGTGSLRLAMRNLDGATIEQLQQWQQKFANNPDDPQALNELLEGVKALLRGKPELILDTQADMTLGDWQGTLTLNFQDFGEINFLQDPTSLLAALEKGLADVTASKTLVETALADMISEELQAQVEGQDPPVSAEAVQNMAAMQASQQLQELVTAGYIRLEGDHYKTMARFENGKLSVNGQEIPLMPPANMDDGMGEEMPPDMNDDGAMEEMPTEPALPTAPAQP